MCGGVGLGEQGGQRKKATGESPNLQMLNSDLQLLPQIHVAQRSLRTGVTLPKRTLGWIAELDFVVLLYRRFFHQKHQELRSRSSSTTLVQVTRYSLDIFVPPYGEPIKSKRFITQVIPRRFTKLKFGPCL